MVEITCWTCGSEQETDVVPVASVARSEQAPG